MQNNEYFLGHNLIMFTFEGETTHLLHFLPLFTQFNSYLPHIFIKITSFLLPIWSTLDYEASLLSLIYLLYIFFNKHFEHIHMYLQTKCRLLTCLKLRNGRQGSQELRCRKKAEAICSVSCKLNVVQQIRAQAVKDQSFSILTLTLVNRSIPGCCSMFSRQYWLPTMKFLGQMITILLR